MATDVTSVNKDTKSRPVYQKTGTKSALKPSFTEKDYQDFLGTDTTIITVPVKQEKTSILGSIKKGASWIWDQTKDVAKATVKLIMDTEVYKKYVAGLFGQVDEGKKEVEKAVKKNDMKTAGEKSKEVLKKSIASSNMSDEKKVAKLEQVSQMSDKEAVKTLDGLYTRLSAAISEKDTPNILNYGKEFEKLVTENPGLKKTNPDKVVKYSGLQADGYMIVKEEARIIIEIANNNPEKSAAEEKKVQEAAISVGEASDGNAFLGKLLADPDIKKIPQAVEVAEKVKVNAEELTKVAFGIIQAAEAKGYKLDNFNLLASIAGIGGGESAGAEVVATTDVTQVNVLNKIKQTFNTLTEDVMNMLMENREENGRLDKAAAEKKAQSNAEEEKYIKIAMLRKEEIKKLINNIQDKKLQNKLTAEVLALSYMLKNPEEITPAQIDAIRDDVNKIKWQVINNRA